jgi:Xaa-Pro aminopeptidase
MQNFPDHLKTIIDKEYPTFSDAEFLRRRAAFEKQMADRGVTHALIRGFLRIGPAVPYFTGWPTTHDAIVLMTPGEQPVLFVNHYNHFPMAQMMARLSDVRWGGASALDTALAELKTRGGDGARLGVVGNYTVSQHSKLQAMASDLIDMGGDYTRLRLIKSEEEHDWMKIGAIFSDMGIAAIPKGLRIGMSEYELANVVERSYMPMGAVNQTHYFMINSMTSGGYCVPRQFSSNRKVQKGDMLATELSAQFWGYSGQILRTVTIGADPTPLYQDLHDVAMAAFDAIVGVLKPGARPEDIMEAATVIEDAGFTIWDDLVHGFGGGYLPPVLGSKSRNIFPVPDMTLEEGMYLVVQPNVITPDNKAGVQTGEMMRITATGAERVHAYPRGLERVEL